LLNKALDFYAQLFHSGNSQYFWLDNNC